MNNKIDKINRVISDIFHLYEAHIIIALLQSEIFYFHEKSNLT